MLSQDLTDSFKLAPRSDRVAPLRERVEST